MRRTSLLRVIALSLLAVAISSTAPRALSSDVVISQVYGGGGNCADGWHNTRAVDAVVRVPANAR